MVKKLTMDPNDPKSYHPLSNLSFVSKVIERLVANQFNKQTGFFIVLPARQSAYQQFRSTETAVTVVHNNIVWATNSKQLSVLVLLDLSSAFDNVETVFCWTHCTRDAFCCQQRQSCLHQRFGYTNKRNTQTIPSSVHYRGELQCSEGFNTEFRSPVWVECFTGWH